MPDDLIGQLFNPSHHPEVVGTGYTPKFFLA